MKKHSLWFILSLTCLACGCESILTFNATECDEEQKPICYEHDEYSCKEGKWVKNGNICNKLECTELDKRQCVDGKITICQKVENRQEWVNTDETCITCVVDQKQCSDEGKTLICQKDGDKYIWSETDEDCVICVIGDKKCSDEGRKLICQKDGDKYIWSETEEKCGNTYNTGDTKCEGGKIYTYTDKDKWGDSPVECEYGCSEGSVQPNKQPLKCYDCGMDKIECENSVLTICNNHKLDQITCDYGCMRSVTSAYCRECAKGETMCEKGAIYTCGENGKWDRENKDECEYGCFNGDRNAETRVSCYECSTDNELKCFTDEDNGTGVIKKCLSHKWYSHTPCEFGCSKDDISQCIECQDGTSKFYNDEDDSCVKKECVSNYYNEGTIYTDVSCNRTLTDKGDCKNGDVRCDGSTGKGIFQFCLDGSWNNFGICDLSVECSVLNGKDCEEFQAVGHICVDKHPVTCANKASCDANNQDCANCQNGTSKCNGNIIKTCVDGSYQDTACQPGTHCESLNNETQCVTNLCENGLQRCEGQEIQYCLNYEWHTVNACSDQELCLVDNDIARCDCKSDIAYCDDEHQFTSCNEGKWQTAYCDKAETCQMIAGKPKCIECEAGQFKCKGEAIVSCQDNHWTEPTACSDNRTCKASEGNAKCICTQGQAKCAKDNTKIIRCQEDGQYGEKEEACGTDMHCEGVAGSAVCTKDPMECTPGAKQCNGNALETCNENGKWGVAVTCEKGCNSNAKICNACRAGEYRCSEIENYDYACVDGQWNKRNKCQYGCDDAECHSCMNETKTCDQNYIRYFCKDNQTLGDIIDNCPSGCNIQTSACYECTPGTTQCYACGYETCSELRTWNSMIKEVCPVECINGKCVDMGENKKHAIDCIKSNKGFSSIIAYEASSLRKIGYVICEDEESCERFRYLCEKLAVTKATKCIDIKRIKYEDIGYDYPTAILISNKGTYEFSKVCSSRTCANDKNCADFLIDIQQPIDGGKQ